MKIRILLMALLMMHAGCLVQTGNPPVDATLLGLRAASDTKSARDQQKQSAADRDMEKQLQRAKENSR
ncbi:MAG: hypothetical protein QM790_03865 [Nibricoccus sp.]